MPRLRNLVPGLLLAAPLFCAVAVAGEPTISVYKSPTCGCCTQWIGHLEDNGFEVNAVDVTDLGRVKSQAGIAPEQASCHTALVGDYVIEGHVPASDIRRLLSEHPEARGLTVPGMPLGSPGMERPIHSTTPTLPGAAHRQGRQYVRIRGARTPCAAADLRAHFDHRPGRGAGRARPVTVWHRRRAALLVTAVVVAALSACAGPRWMGAGPPRGAAGPMSGGPGGMMGGYGMGGYGPGMRGNGPGMRGYGAGMMGGSMLRHRQVMTGGIPAAYAQLRNPLPSSAG